MSIKKNKYSTCVVFDQENRIVGYLSSRDEEQGLDLKLAIRGFTIVAL